MSGERPGFRWVAEWQSPHTVNFFEIKKLIFSGRTKYQEVMVVELYDFGLALILDGKVQSSIFDEFIYHELLVHPAMLAHPNPKKVLLIGGGEGATLREVLKHPVEKVVMVDVDEEVVEICKKYMREMHQGSFDDPRVKLIIEDGRRFLKEGKEMWDVIIIDVTDPIEGGPSKLLYTKEFYEIASERLDPKGVLVTQSSGMYIFPETFATIYRTIKEVFKYARATEAYVPVYMANWSFVIASDFIDPKGISAELAEKRAQERGLKGLKFFEPKRYPAYFWIPPFIEEYVKKAKIAHDDSPVIKY